MLYFLFFYQIAKRHLVYEIDAMGGVMGEAADVSAIQYKKLNKSNIDYVLDNSIVRGLDYYNDTVFEWKHASLGSQDAICAGGRYDSLVNNVGGVHVPAIGFAAGIERIISLLTKFNKITTQNKTVVAINYSKKSNYLCLRKLEKLRDQFKKITFYTTDSSSTLHKQFKQAEKLNPRYILYLRGKISSD